MNDLMSHKLAFDNQKSNMELKPSPRISTRNHEMELKPRNPVLESVVSYLLLQSDNHENKNLNVGIVNLSCNLDDNTLEVVEKVLQQTPGKDDKTNTACPDPDADAAFSAFKTIPTVASSSTGTTSRVCHKIKK